MAKRNTLKQTSGDVAQRDERSHSAVVLWLEVMLLLVLVGGGVVLGVMKLNDPKLLPLRVVRIEGELRHLQRLELEQAVADLSIGGFLTVDVGAIRDKAQALAWVDKLSVRRVWPDSLQIWVVEQVPLARWGGACHVKCKG